MVLRDVRAGRQLVTFRVEALSVAVPTHWPGSAADELAKLSKLHDEKKLSDEEFERAKAKIVG